MSLLARKTKLLMQKFGPAPFLLSGTFASDLDGWVGAGVSRITNNVRTAPGAMQVGLNFSFATYVIPKEICAGLTIEASVWVRLPSSGSEIVSFRYRIGSGSQVNIESKTISSTTYTLFSGSFINAGNDDVAIIIGTGGGNVIADDWSFSGS